MQNKFFNTTQCYLRRNSQTLMLHRTKKVNDPLHGKWIAVGGKFEPGECPEDCVIREVYEETGLILIELKLRGIMSFTIKKTDTSISDCYAFIFESRNFSGELIDSPEGDLEWVDDNKVTQLDIFDKDKIFLPWIYDSKKFFSAKFSSQETKLVSHDVKFY